MTRLIDRECGRCGKAFQAKAKTGQYIRKYCSEFCTYNGRRGSDEDRFFAKVKKTNGCWQWVGSTNNEGYGEFWYDGKLRKAHRFAQENWNAKLKSGQVAMHSCDNARCVNPKHLSAGSLSDNSRDCLNKNRKRSLKLTVEQVRTIRRALEGPKPKWKVYEAMAKEYGVNASAIYHIYSGRTWRWVA